MILKRFKSKTILLNRYAPRREMLNFEGENTQIGIIKEAVHKPLSYAITHNCEGVSSPIVRVVDGDTETDRLNLIHNFMADLEAISDANYLQMKKEYKEISDLIDKTIEETEKFYTERNATIKTGPIFTLKRRFDCFLRRLPCCGFNSAKYDLLLIKPYMVNYLMTQKEEPTTICNGNAIINLKTTKLDFIDIYNYAKTSLDGFNKSFEAETSKSYFCYTYVKSVQQLDETELPPRRYFYNDLKKCEMPLSAYQELQSLWVRNKWSTLRDLLIYYNTLDVEPFHQAVQNYCRFYHDSGIDVLGCTISLPGASVAYGFEMLTEPSAFHTFHNYAKYAHTLIRNNLRGGLSIVFNRRVIADKTKIPYIGQKTVRKILGLDCNALYLYSIAQKMPSGPPRTYKRHASGPGVIISI